MRTRVMWMGIISQHTIISSDKSPVGGWVCAAGAMPQMLMLPDGFTSHPRRCHAVAATGSAATVKSQLAHSPPLPHLTYLHAPTWLPA